MRRLAFDVGSNSVGSAWLDTESGEIVTGTSIFPAGVDEADDKRGDPKNAKRRMARRARITLARRSIRKRELRLRLISAGLLPPTEEAFRELLEGTDPWALRAKALDNAITPHEFGRVLLHLAQRRGALGLITVDEDDGDEAGQEDDGKVKKAIGEVRAQMIERSARSFGEFICIVRTERVTAITGPDRRHPDQRIGPREYRTAIRNKPSRYEHCADRAMIRDEFSLLWNTQKKFGGAVAGLLTDSLRNELDSEGGDTLWRHKGLLFGQRRQTWDLGTLGRCALEPTERCVPHADMYASRFRVVETINNLRVIERGKEPRPLTPDERVKISEYLSGPLGMEKPRKTKSGQRPARPKTSASVTDLRLCLGWGRATKTSQFRFNIERDADRTINTDWFRREIIHGAIALEVWSSMPERVREGINRAILRFNPDDDAHSGRLRAGLMGWAGLTAAQADATVAAWQRRPKLDAKRLTMSRKAVRNLLAFMDRTEPWPDPRDPASFRWITAIEARKMVADTPGFRDMTTGAPLAAISRPRYATGARGATARDRYYMRKHVLVRGGEPILDESGMSLAEPPPAPLISNPVVRKAIHEVRRHLVEYMIRFGRKPDHISIELSREARMGAKQADSLLFRNRLRSRIRSDIIETFNLDALSPSQQRAAVVRVVLAMQQRGVCPLCGNTVIETMLTPRIAAAGTDCEVAHIIPRACGGHNGLGNTVLAHTKCNRDMARRTPRDFWNADVSGGYDAGINWVEHIYGDIDRPTAAGNTSASGDALWESYFTRRDSESKLEQFKKAVNDIQEMTNRQDAATKYATRQVMGYLADAVYGGGGLPERGGQRRIFATDGIWTSRLRREWGLFFDPHDAKLTDVDATEVTARREKNRGDHRHHAVDAIIIGYCTADVQQQWDDRERRAEHEVPNTADESAMEAYRRLHPLPAPAPFRTLATFRDAVRHAVFGANAGERPICHRPVKRKLVGALHEETLFGPVLDPTGGLSGYCTSRKQILEIQPKHLRLPVLETEQAAIRRLASRRIHEKGCSEADARRWARGVVRSGFYTPRHVDPPPEKTGIVRDLGLRNTIRRCLDAAGIDPDSFTKLEMKRLVEAGGVRHASGVPIRAAVLLRSMEHAVIIDRRRQEYATGRFVRDPNPASKRAYVGGNNHHIEIREATDGKLTGVIVSAFEAAQRKLAKLRAFKIAGIPKPAAVKALPHAARRKLRPLISQIECDHPIVDRRFDESKGGRFVMSLAEGEMLFVCGKGQGGEIGRADYYVVAKLEKPNRVVLVPHWDARAAGGRKDSSGGRVQSSKREDVSIVPSDLRTLAPDGEQIAFKVRVSALGEISRLLND